MNGIITSAIVSTSIASSAMAADTLKREDLAGTWTLVAADRIESDGKINRDYGEAPKGRLIIDASGRYSLQIFKSERAKFQNADKGAASPVEFKSAVMGSSTHYGWISVEPQFLSFHIEGASFPNWEGTVQRRSFEFNGDTLQYKVPPRPDGSVPVSIWRRER